MKQFYPSGHSSKSITSLKKNKKNLSEQDIIELHAQFLTNGIHNIKVKNVQEGRKLVYTLLQSLQYYQKTACLTLDKTPLKKGVIDLYYQLSLTNYLNTANPNRLREFFIESCNFDFMWIEESVELVNQEWLDSFQKVMVEFNLDQHMPIIVLNSH
ncbi:hypothetical protein HRU45_02515 [Candidatus Dependentiae bacterium]|nr:hypothetical protein [Candidatus Dependentiae bacterium]